MIAHSTVVTLRNIWPEISEVLQRELDQIKDDLVAATPIEFIGLQAEARARQDMLNLPNVLETLWQSEEESRKRQREMTQ